MADIAKAGTPSLASTLPCPAHQVTGLLAGEALAAGDACYIKASDGKVWRSTGAAANAAAEVVGYAAQKTPVGEAVTLYHSVVFSYGSGLTPGTLYYLSGATAGGLADAASTGGTKPVARALDASRVFLMQSRY